MPAKRTDKAYAAGLLDGEGCVGIYHRSNADSWAVFVRVANTDIAVLRWLQDIWGGSVTLQHATTKHKPCWSWSTSTKAAFAFLLDVRPFVKIKLRQVENAIAFRKYVSQPGIPLDNGQREAQAALAEANRVLNKRGRG